MEKRNILIGAFLLLVLFFTSCDDFFSADADDTATLPFSDSLSAQIHLLPGTAIPTGRPIRNLSGFKLHFVYNDCI